MNHIFIKKITILVLLSLFTMIVAPHYLFSKNRIRELGNAKRMYEQGNYDLAFEMIEDIINTYDKEKYRDELCDAYYYRAKIFFSFEKYIEMRKTLLELYQTNRHYKLPSEEDKEFIEYAYEIREEVRTLSKNEKKEINERTSIPITINITNEIPDGVFICVDDLNLGRAKPIKQNRVELELFPGEHRFYFILKSKGKVLVEDLEVKEKISLTLTLIFSKGHNITSLLPTSSNSNKKVIEKTTNAKKKKKKIPVLLAVGAAVVGGALFFLLKKKENSNSSSQNNDPSNQGDKIYFETEPKKIEIIEDETQTLKVKLSKKPPSDVKVIVKVKEEDCDFIKIESKKVLTFAPNDYYILQEVTIRALPVDKKENATIQLRGNNIQNKDISVSIMDIDDYGNPSVFDRFDSEK